MDQIRANGTKLIFDNYDAFARIDDSHPEYEIHRERATNLDRLMQISHQVWFATEAISEKHTSLSSNWRVIPNSLDSRVWREYGNPRPSFSHGKKLRLLYLGTAKHNADFELLLDALDDLATRRPGSFNLTLVGAVHNPLQRSWLKLLLTPGGSKIYPKFVRWLLKQGPFDVGLSPLVDNPFNRCASDIKFLDYSGLGLLSVLSDLPPYQGDAKGRKLAVLVNNSTEGWRGALETLVQDKSEFTDRMEAAQSYLWEERTASATAVQQVECLREVLDAAGN